MYIPIMKNRTIELSVLKDIIDLGLCDQIIPLIEVIQDRSRSNSQRLFKEELSDIFSGFKYHFFLDFPKINVSNSIAKPVKEFMTTVNRNKHYYIEQHHLCSNIDGIIPVISYNQKEDIDSSVFERDIFELRPEFKSISIRITPSQYKQLGDSIFKHIKKDDFLLLDINNKGHTNPAIKNIYKLIKSIKKEIGFKSFILNSNKPDDLYNKNIKDGEPIEDIDNSLLEVYKTTSYGFDGFGDYSCISNTLPTNGGAISPAGIYYSRENNFFVGYKGRKASLSEFSDYIAPSIVNSEYWNEYNENHHITCPGCKRIKAIAEGSESGKSQAIWKGITIGHYIYTVHEILTSK